jgi:hypothetical protein
MKNSLLLLILAGPALLRADLLNQLFVTPASSGGSGPCGTTFSAPTGPTDQSCSATGGFNSSGDGETLVDYGHVHVRGSANGGFDEESVGTIQDSLTFHIPGVADGTAGSFTYELIMSGKLAATSDFGEASWQLQTTVGGGTFDLSVFGRLETASGGNPGVTGVPYGVFFATGHFQSGIAAPLYISLRGNSQARFTFTGPGSATDDSTLFWGGISDVVAGGSPVPGFTVTSDSRTNWANSLAPNPVPDPSTVWLLAGPCLAVFWLRRSRRDSAV